jgi:hypothetical protein
MSKLHINLDRDFVPASRLTRKNSRLLNREPLTSKLSFLLSVTACLAGLFLIYLLFFR